VILIKFLARLISNFLREVNLKNSNLFQVKFFLDITKNTSDNRIKQV
jgi:hypothetical protein